jgi:hypothetical protein
MTQRDVDNGKQMRESGDKGGLINSSSSSVNTVMSKDQKNKTHSALHSAPVMDQIHADTEVPKDSLDQMSRFIKTILGLQSETPELNIDQTKSA